MIDLNRDGPVFVLSMRAGENRINAALHEAVVTGRRFGAIDACARGIVTEACSDEELLPRAVELARELAGKDRATMVALKRALHREALAELEGP